MNPNTCARRRAALQKALAKAEVDALLIHSPVNVFYYSGFESTYCILVIGKKDAHLLTDGRYIEAARKLSGFRVHEKSQGAVPKELDEIAKKLKAKRLGFEPAISYGTFEQFKEAVGKGVELVCASELLGAPRALKSADEARAIEVSQRLNEKIFLEAVEQLREAGPGACTEREFAGLLRVLMIREGAEPSFDPIVAHGANGSFPHYHPGDTVLGSGPTLIDMGVKVAGYCSDMTRMIHIGRPTAKFQRMYDAVRAAKNAGLKALKKGAKAAKVHEAAVKELKKAKLEKYFSHGLGHGLGLEIHEAPRLAPTSDHTVEIGHVVTVEPGVYIAGWGGVRIEDMAFVSRSGVKRLTKLSDDLLVI